MLSLVTFEELAAVEFVEFWARTECFMGKRNAQNREKGRKPFALRPVLVVDPFVRFMRSFASASSIKEFGKKNRSERGEEAL